jgi:hypothetical protein
MQSGQRTVRTYGPGSWPLAPDSLIVPLTFGARCALCWEAFRIGDVYKSIWPKTTAGGWRSAAGDTPRPPTAGTRPPVRLGISVHLGCFGQLDPGDLTRIFGALEKRLAIPIAVLNGRRWDLAEN